jgi:hypothetical protein
MTCATNRTVLNELGINYPKFTLRLPELNFGVDDIRNHGTPIVSQLVQFPEELPFFSRINCPSRLRIRAINCFREQFTRALASERKVLISGESISLLSFIELRKLRDLIRDYVKRTTVIVVVRNPTDQLISSQNQLLKQSGRGAIFEHHLMIEQSLLLKNLIGVFDQVKILSFERLLKHPQGLIGGFFEAVGIYDLDKITFQSGNVSPPNQAVRLISYLHNEKRLANEYSNQLHEFGKEVTELPGEKFRLTISELKLAEDHIAKENDALTTLLGKDFFESDLTQLDPHIHVNEKVHIEYNLDYLVRLTVILSTYPPVFTKVVWEYFEKSSYVSPIQRDVAMGLRDIQVHTLSSASSDGFIPLGFRRMLQMIVNHYPNISKSTYNWLCLKGKLQTAKRK